MAFKKAKPTSLSRQKSTPTAKRPFGGTTMGKVKMARKPKATPISPRATAMASRPPGAQKMNIGNFTGLKGPGRMSSKVKGAQVMAKKTTQSGVKGNYTVRNDRVTGL